jgi:hypothetical protein
VQGHAEAIRDSHAISLVPVQELNNAGGLAETSDPLVQSRAIDRVRQPDLSSGGQSM